VLDLAASIALSHQEKWDGTGYPRGLAGESIPVEGRIVAIADVFDALTTDRVYRKAFPVEEAVQMMRDQRGKHFDPVLLDAFMEVLERAGADARGELRANLGALAEQTLETFGTALERGDAETAEGAVAQAIEDEIPAATLHSEVIAPALRRIGELREAQEIDAETEQLATGITRRILATLYRYMLGGADPTREHILLAGIEGAEQRVGGHTLGLQMVHDQLAAAGYQTTLQAQISPGRLAAALADHEPDVLVLGADPALPEDTLERLLEELGEHHPGLPVLLGSASAGAAVNGIGRRAQGVHVLERIELAVPAVEGLLAEREHALG
jgi:methanogenic corrinoid protein MtbC1